MRHTHQPVGRLGVVLAGVVRALAPPPPGGERHPWAAKGEYPTMLRSLKSVKLNITSFNRTASY